MMVGLIIGAYIGLKYLLWEMEKFPPKQTAAPVAAAKEGGTDWNKVQPWIGALVFVAGIVGAIIYCQLCAILPSAVCSCSAWLSAWLFSGPILFRTRFPRPLHDR